MNAQVKTHFGKTLLEKPGKERYFEFLSVDTLSAGIYRLQAGSEDPQNPHSEDEVYYVLAGKASIMVDGNAYPAEAGDAIFVPAYTEHRFVEIAEDLTVLVFFSKFPVTEEKGEISIQ